jgi:hypothetical protein
MDVPLQPDIDSFGYRIPGYTPPDGATTVSIKTNIVSATYFETLGLSFVRGRAWQSGAGQAPTAVINETMAKRFWPGQDAVGRPIEFLGKGMITVTGVVRDSAYYAIGEEPMPFVYVPAEVANPLTYTLLARTNLPADDLLPALVRSVTVTDARVRPLDPITFEESRLVQLYPQRLLATTAFIFGVVALLLTSIGLYGVVSTSVGQRTREIGVRMALGARSAEIQRGVLRASATLVGCGALVGLAGGYAVAGAVRQWLFGVAPFDLELYAAVALALCLVAVAAAWVPARRAARVDPVIALRT